MSKKVQIIVWAIIAAIVCILAGGYIYFTADRLMSGNTHPEVTFEVQDYGTIKMELYPEYAPNTVANFIKLVEKGYYNNKVVYGKDDICLYVGRNSEGEIDNPKTSLVLDKVEENSDYDYEYTIPGEFIANGYKENTLKHEKGVVTLIRNDYTQYVGTLTEESYNSGNSQLGIMMGDEASNLNGLYASFAKITEGMDVVENIYNNREVVAVETETDENGEEVAQESAIDAFANYPVITSASVDTKGVNYGEPKVEEAFDYQAYMYDLMSSYYGNN